MIDREHARRLELAEGEALLDMFAAAPELARSALGLRSGRPAGAHAGAVRAIPDARELNHVIGLGMTRLADADALAEVKGFFAGHPPGWSIAVSPAAAPEGLAERLQEDGYTPGYAWAKFHRPAASPPAAETTLRLTPANEGDADAFGAVVAAGFGMPPVMAPWLAALVGRDRWTCLLAWAGDEPVGAGALFVHEQVGWLGMAAVLPAHRGLGAQRALLSERIRLAVDQGCDTLTTETGKADSGRPGYSHANILASGFEIAYLRPNLIPPAE
jgi:GNAT superfamily N-acetyltransferase